MRYANSRRWNDDDDDDGGEDDDDDVERDDVVDVRDPVLTTIRQKTIGNDDTHGCNSYDGGKLVVSMPPMGRGAVGNASDHSPRSTGTMEDIIVGAIR